MAEDVHQEEPWVLRNWFSQIVFYLILIVFYLREVDNGDRADDIWFYVLVTTALLICAGINAILLGPPMQRVLAATAVLSNAFLIPLGLTAAGISPGVCGFLGAAYLAVTIVLSPTDVGLFMLLAGVAFTWLYKQQFVQGGAQLPWLEYLRLAVGYLAMGAVALAWRLLLRRAYDVLSGPPPPELARKPAGAATADKDPATVKQGVPTNEDEFQKLFDDYMRLDREHRQLKEGVAQHVVQVNGLADKVQQHMDVS